MGEWLHLTKNDRFALTAEMGAIFGNERIRSPFIDRLLGTDNAKGEYKAEEILSVDGLPLFLGLTEAAESRKVLGYVGKNEWIIHRLNGKLVVNGWFDNASAAAFRHLIQLRDAEETAQLPIVGSLEGYFDFPDCGCGCFAGGIDSDAGAVIYRYTDVSEKQMDAYVQKLTQSGYDVCQRNDLGQNRFVTLRQGERALVVSWLGSGRELRVVADRAEHQGCMKAEPVLRSAESKLSLLNLYHHYADGNDIGLCMLFTLSDGSLLVIDGGQIHDAGQLYRAMVHCGGSADGTVTVAAWIITHDHMDHTGAFAQLAMLPAAKLVRVENILYSGNGESFLWRTRFDPYYYSAGPAEAFVPGRMEKLAAAYGGQTRSIRPHMGQKFFFRDAEVDVLCAGAESLYPRVVNNFNDTSLVCKIKLGGQTTLVLGDSAADAAKDVLIGLFDGQLDCDILQVSHHGLGGMSAELYPRLRASVALWPTTRKTMNRYNLQDRAYNKSLQGIVKQTLVADGVMQVLRLPYDPERDLPEVVELGDYTLSAEEEAMILPRVNDIQMHRCDLKLPRELMLSAGEYGVKATKLLSLLLPQSSICLVGEGAHIQCEKNPALIGEAYTVETVQGKVRIGYQTYTGLRNALATFSQFARLCPNGLQVPQLKLWDAPVCKHRGVMLDLARGVKDFGQFCRDMVLMARARMNVLHIHLSDAEGFGIRLKSLPETVCHEKAYTRQQVRELAELADVLALELIPEIDMPAHGNRLLTEMTQLRCGVDRRTHPSLWTTCPGKEATFLVFEQVIREVCGLFPGRYFHVGGDELEFADLPKLNQYCYWDDCPDCRRRMAEEGLADRSELYYYFIRRIHSVVTSCGRRMIMWSDQVDGEKEVQLPRDIIMQFWRIAGRGRGPSHSCSMEELLAMGYEVINSRYQDTYIDIESYLSEDSIRDWRWDRRPECSGEQAEKILGSELCCWEYGNEERYPHYWTSLPSGIFLMADKLWNGDVLPYSAQYSQALTRAVLGIGVPYRFNIWNSFGGLIPPRTGKLHVYKGKVTDNPQERETVLAVLEEGSYYAFDDYVRARAYKARLEGEFLSIPEPVPEPDA